MRQKATAEEMLEFIRREGQEERFDAWVKSYRAQKETTHEKRMRLFEPKRMIYNGYSEHDSEAHYKCPYCGEDHGSWTLYINGIGRGSEFKCFNCGALLIAPD